MSIYEQEWPPLVEESRDLLIASILMYGLTDLRSLGRQGKLKEGDAERILNFPFTIKDVLYVVDNNKEVLQAYFGEEGTKLYGAANLSIRQELLQAEADGKGIILAEVVAFDDEYSEEQLVYAITVNQARKRIVVAFRGSTTVKDFMVDADGHFCDLDNPLEPDSNEKLGVHHGFYEYLNGKPKSRSKTKANDDDDVQVNKYTEIMIKLKPIFEEYPGYRLYCTGHSLGASLALLFALQAAASTSYSVPKPVTCINFASPKVGNVDFRTSFQTLEVEGKIRCIRFVNAGDLVPTLPDRQNCSICRTLRCRPNVYRHCGPKVILHADGGFEIAYEKDDAETIWRFLLEVRYTFGHGLGFALMIPALLRFKNFFMTNHGCDTYLRRFNSEFAKSDLRLNDIYKREVNKLAQKRQRSKVKNHPSDVKQEVESVEENLHGSKIKEHTNDIYRQEMENVEGKIQELKDKKHLTNMEKVEEKLLESIEEKFQDKKNQ